MSFSKLYNSLRPPLKVYWWRYDYPNQLNFGDEITPEIIRHITGRNCIWSPPSECTLAGAGSIIEILQSLSHNNPINVWGSGFIKEGEISNDKNLNFLAIRGELSQSRIDKKVPLGDPGLLTSLVYKKSPSVTHKIGIVAHYADSSHPALQAISKNPDYIIINPLQTPSKVIKAITSCELILSSSLHGLIVADSFGIPNQWMPLSNELTGGDYKFKDYCSSIDKPLNIFLHANISNVALTEDVINNYTSIKSIETIQSGLIRSLQS